MTSTRLAWHQSQWAVISQALEKQRLPHALLLHGANGLGKQRFLEQLAHLLICANPVPDSQTGLLSACAACRPCTQFSEQGAHADIYHLQPEEAGKQIKVGDTRAAIEFSGLASHYGGRKLLLIEPAEALNLNAANALLKTLEEPASSTTLVLLSHRPSRLLPTIRSRCLQLRFSKPDREQAISWLREQGVEAAEAVLDEAHGYPLQALNMDQAGVVEWRQQRDRELALFLSEKRSASGLARLWTNFEATDIHAWLHDRLRRVNWAAHGQTPTAVGTGKESKNAAMQGLLQMPQLRRLELLSSQLDQLIKLNIHNINNQLCMESLLISMSDDSASPSHS